jgi:hypothetical protein
MNATAAACCPSFGHASGPEPANRLKNNSPHEGYVVTSLEDRKRAASARAVVKPGMGLMAPT